MSEDQYKASKEAQPYYTPYYRKLFSLDPDREGFISRHPEGTELDIDYKIDLTARDWWNTRRTVQERYGSHEYLSFLTALIGCHYPGNFGDGEIWDCIAEIHVTGYGNKENNGLAAFIPCNFAALRKYIISKVDITRPISLEKSRMTRQNEHDKGKYFIHIPLAQLMRDPLAQKLGVLISEHIYLDKEANKILKEQKNTDEAKGGPRN